MFKIIKTDTYKTNIYKICKCKIYNMFRFFCKIGLKMYDNFVKKLLKNKSAVSFTV
jgi:hypothetical protein